MRSKDLEHKSQWLARWRCIGIRKLVAISKHAIVEEFVRLTNHLQEDLAGDGGSHRESGGKVPAHKVNSSADDQTRYL
jgi:hypothetical protein